MSDEVATFQMEPKRSPQAGDSLLDFLHESSGHPVVLDASAVEFIGARDLQLLISAKHQWEVDRHSFVVAPRSDAFQDGLNALGVADDFFQKEVGN